MQAFMKKREEDIADVTEPAASSIQRKERETAMSKLVNDMTRLSFF